MSLTSMSYGLLLSINSTYLNHYEAATLDSLPSRIERVFM
jgi:hypothetical protein